MEAAKAILEEAGYEVLVFHATGTGGRTMESLIESGQVAGVLDVTTTEWADQLVGGVLAAGPNRLEAAARSGIPAIVTDAPGCTDTVEDHKDGLIVAVNAPEEIAERILLLERHEQLRASIVEQGMRKAAKQDWDNIAAEYLRVYEAIQNQR